MEFWAPGIALILSNFILILSLLLWSRYQSLSDIRDMDAKLNDFNNRLSDIEERNKDK